MGNFSTKMVSLVSVATLTVTTMGVSLVSAASEFLPYAETLASNDVISTQSTEAGYRLGDTITRAELAKVTANLGGYTPTDCAGNVFGDVTSNLGDLCGYIEALADAGVVTTANANYRPSANVTRAEMIKMILGAVGETGSDVDSGYMDIGGLNDLAGFINRANELGCAATATYFRPMATASRGEAFKIASCIAYPADTETPVDNGTGSTSTGTTVTAGSLSVALDGTAVAQYVPKNASSVKVGAVKLTAGAKDVTVRSLVVSRSGLGNASDITSTTPGIRAAMNGVIVSSSADYYNSTSQKGTVYFSPALVVKAGASATVDVLVNLSGAENSQHQFTLDAVNTDGTVSGAPITLGLLNTTSYVTTTTTANVVASAGTITPGKSAQSVFKVEMTAGGRDTKVTSFTLTRSGSTDFTKRLANAKAYRNGVEVGTVSMTNEKLAVTGLSDVLQSGNTQTYEIKADILVDSTTAPLGVKWDSSSDVVATEVATGYATQVTATPTTGAFVGFNKVEVTFTKQSTGSVTLAPGTNNIKLFAGKLSTAVPLTVRGITISRPTSGSGVDAFVNDQLSVKLNGSEIATITTADNLVAGVAKTVSFVVDSANPGTLTIEGSIKNNTSVNGSFTFTVALTDVRDSNNNQADVGAGKSLTGDKTTINTAQVEVKSATVAAPSSSRLYSSASQEIGRFAVTSRNEASRVQTVALTVSTGGTATGLNILAIANSTSSVKLYNVDTNTEVSSTPTISGNTITFDSMNDTITTDTTRNYKVVLDTSSIENYYGGTITLSSPTVTAVRDSNSTSVSVTGTATTKTYTLGTVSPTVLVTAVSENVFKVKVTNPDSNTGVTLTSAKFDLKTALPGNTTYTATACLRDLGSSLTCGSGTGTSTATGAVPALAQTIAVAGLTTNMMADKNNGVVEFEVYVTSANLLPTGGQLQVALTQLNYNVGAGSSYETYVGTTGASATFTK